MSVNVSLNPIFRAVHESKLRYVVMKGSAGSGKSFDTATCYILRLMQDKGRNLVCIRKSDISNRNSTFSELVGAINRMGLTDYWTYTTSPMSINCKNGNKIIFRGVNDDKQREKLKSITFEKGKLTDVWIEEATEISRYDLEIIDDRLRGKLPVGQFYQIKLTFNPVSANHWIKQYFFDRIDENVLTHHSTYLDNLYNDEAYHQRMLRRKKTDYKGYQVYALGEWGESDGLILTNWSVKMLEKGLEYYDSIYYGQDFGFNHANVILDVRFKDGDIYVIDEIFTTEALTSEVIDIAKKRGYLPNKIMYCDSAEPDRIKQFKNAGFLARGVKKEGGCIMAQIQFLKNRMIYINANCENLIREISQWKWRGNTESGNYLDEPIPFKDDAISALRYAIEEQRKGSSIGFLV